MASLVVSDLHFGDTRSYADTDSSRSLLQPFLARAERLILLGDAWSAQDDPHSALNHGRAWMRWAGDQVDEVIWIPGNHDARLYPMLTKETSLHLCGTRLTPVRGPQVFDGVFMLHGYEQSVWLPHTFRAWANRLIRCRHKQGLGEADAYAEQYFPTDSRCPNLAWIGQNGVRHYRGVALAYAPRCRYVQWLQIALMLTHLPGKRHWLSDETLEKALVAIARDCQWEGEYVIAAHTHRPHNAQRREGYQLVRTGAWVEEGLARAAWAFTHDGQVEYYTE